MPDTPIVVDARALHADLRRVTAGFEEALRGITLPRLFWKPEARAWSAAQILDHLLVSNAGYVPQLEEALARLEREGRRAEGPFKVGFLMRAFVKGVSPGTRAMGAPSAYVPTDTPTADLPDRFLAHQRVLDRIFAQAVGLDLRAAKVTSPANRMITMKAGEALLVIVRHEERHLLQLVRVLERGPTGG